MKNIRQTWEMFLFQIEETGLFSSQMHMNSSLNKNSKLSGFFSKDGAFGRSSSHSAFYILVSQLYFNLFIFKYWSHHFCFILHI